MISPGDRVARLAGPMSRRPTRFAIAGILVGILGVLGLLRFSVNSGQSLLVGSNSAAGQTYTSFAKSFGSDPIVMVFSSRNPTAPYLESNLARLGALEIDLAHDPRVASVLGPGTAAASLRQAALAEVQNVLVEYPYFVAETDYLEQIQAGNTDQNALSQRLQTDITDARALLELYVVKASSDSHNARAAYAQHAGDRVIDSREKAVDAAVAQDPLPPLWAEYIAGPGQPTDQTEARAFFDRVTAAFGDCDDQIAALLKISPSCQVFFERTLLDLPDCPKVGTGQFCAPKSQWAAVLPAAAPGADSLQITTIRLKPEYVDGQAVAAKGCNNPCNISTLLDKIDSELAHGIATDSYTRSLGASSLQALQKLGPLQPSECGGTTAQQDPACNAAFHDARLPMTMAGAPLLAQGLVRSMTQLLAILFPVALLVMVVILVALFRVRGRAWPLLAAGAATVLTVGVSLLTGTPITPAVLAGVPVLVGLAVDYAVQFVARFDQERARTDDTEAALRTVLQNAGRATMIAGSATIAGLLAMALVSGIDGGPLVAVPLVAEFALVLAGGVVLAWLAGLFIALPLAVWSYQRGLLPAQANKPALKSPARTIAIADNWRGVTALAGVLALGGWIALHFVPVQTDVQQLVSPSLPELVNVQTVQAQTGYTNEVDLYVQGQVAGPYDKAGTPQNVQWQCNTASELRSQNKQTVATATSIADFFIASASQTTPTSGQLCVQSSSTSPSPAPSPSPSPSPGRSSTPSATPTPSSSASPAAAGAARGTARLAAATPTPSAPPSPSITPSASATPVPSSSGTQSTPKQQTRFLCELRLFPLLSRVLVGPIGPDTQACPPVDEFQQRFITTDTTSIDPNVARIAIGVRATSVSAEAQLVDELSSALEGSTHPPNGLVAAPAGLAVLATTAYDNLVNRSYLLNLVPLAAVALALWAIFREPRRAFLPLLPAALAAGWAPLVLLLLGRLPGAAGATLGSLNPLTVVLGGLVIALGTEFGVMLLSRFYEARRQGLDPDAAAGVAITGVGRPIAISAATLGAGFAVLAISGLFPNAFPLIAAFGLDVVIDLSLAVGAVFVVMLPLAVALERSAPLPQARPVAETAAHAGEVAPVAEAASPVVAAPKTRARRPAAKRAAAANTDRPEITAEVQPPAPEPAAEAQSRRRPGVSGRRRAAPPDGDAAAGGEQSDTPATRRPGVSGRRRGNRPPA